MIKRLRERLALWVAPPGVFGSRVRARGVAARPRNRADAPRDCMGGHGMNNELPEGDDWVRRGETTLIRTTALDKLLAQRDALIADLYEVVEAANGVVVVEDWPNGTLEQRQVVHDRAVRLREVLKRHSELLALSGLRDTRYGHGTEPVEDYGKTLARLETEAAATDERTNELKARVVATRVAALAACRRASEVLLRSKG